jgi:hypothetical protein
VNSAIGEVGDLIGMAECKPATAAGVTGVSGRAGITLANRMRHSSGIDATDQTASTFHEELVVPLGSRRQPDFGLDFRIGRWSESDGNPTVSCGLDCGSDVRQARHVGTRCLREQRDGEKEEQVHAYKLTASAAPAVRAKPLSGHRDPLSSVGSERIRSNPEVNCCYQTCVWKKSIFLKIANIGG